MTETALRIHDLAEDPDRLERAMAHQQELSRTDAGIRRMMESIYLEADRNAAFDRFQASFEFRTILKLFDIFKVDRRALTCEIGGGPGFLAWAMAQSGFAAMHLLELNTRPITGTGYLRGRPDAGSVTIHDDLATWHAGTDRFALIVTKNCIHHFKNISQAAAAIRQKLTPGARWFAFREWFAETPRELYDQLAGHPFSQTYGLYEWPYPAWHYVEAIEIAGFKLKGIVPLGYANNTLCTFQENTGGPEAAAFDQKVDEILTSNPEATAAAFWDEVLKNRFQNGATRLFSRPQALVFEVAPIR